MLEPKIRASECQKSTKKLREYIQLVPKSILTIKKNTDNDTDPTDENTQLSLVQRADQCALRLHNSSENKGLVSEFYNTAK